MTSHHVRLVIMARADPDMIRRAVRSASSMVNSVMIVVAPDDPSIPQLRSWFGEMGVVEQEWLGFAKTRTMALRHAERDVEWVMMVDADDVFAPNSVLPDLDRADAFYIDSFHIPIDLRGDGWRWRWLRDGHLMRAQKGFSWVGTGESDRHEVLLTPQGCKTERFNGLVYSNVYVPSVRVHDAVRQPGLANQSALQPKAGGRTYEGDARSFSNGSTKIMEPRAAFYHAQSLKDAGRYVEAFRAFAHRATLVGFHEETFWAKLWMGKLAPNLGYNPVPYFEAAHIYFPERAEPLHALESYYRNLGMHDQATLWGTLAGACAYPMDAKLFVEVHTYSERALMDAGIDP